MRDRLFADLRRVLRLRPEQVAALTGRRGPEAPTSAEKGTGPAKAEEAAAEGEREGAAHGMATADGRAAATATNATATNATATNAPATNAPAQASRAKPGPLKEDPLGFDAERVPKTHLLAVQLEALRLRALSKCLAVVSKNKWHRCELVDKVNESFMGCLSTRQVELFLRWVRRNERPIEQAYRSGMGPGTAAFHFEEKPAGDGSVPGASAEARPAEGGSATRETPRAAPPLPYAPPADGGVPPAALRKDGK
jgi:hypothetical protein